MIKTISIVNHKSFHPTTAHSVRLDHNKTATYIYGLNGAGKSAIAEVVDGIGRGDTKFEHCGIETTDGARYRYIVYNQSFVDRVIGEPMKGIFTVGEVDTVRQQRIDEIGAKTGELDAQIASDEERVFEAGRGVEKELERAKQEVWKAYELGKNSSLKDFLKGYGRDAKKFFRDLRTHQLPDDGKLDSIDRLEKRWADVSSTESERTLVSIDTSALGRIERDSIWEEPVEVSSSSSLALLVAELGNADWVARGQDFLHNDRCPFCQQALPQNFRDELMRLLEGEREAKVDKIRSLVDAYSGKVQALETRVDLIIKDPEAKTTGLDLAWSELRSELYANLTNMQSKEAEPSKVVEINSSPIEALTDAVAKLNVSIADFNARIRDRKGERDRIREMFYQVLHADRVEAYARHDALIVPLRATEAKAKAELEEKKKTLHALNEELRELRGQQKGVDASIDAINNRLRSLGISTFSVQRKNDQERLYTLKRPGVPVSDTLTLSEGEKTLIAFLYFMESLKGSLDENENVDPKKTIAVIDDPISSLSQNFIYDIATMIHHELVKPVGRPQLVKQVVVLTHNLFFFHELLRQTKKKGCALRRVVKSDYTAVQEFDPDTLMNDYDAWWQVLKDAKESRVPVQIIPNAMRCILEQFFTFTAGTSDIPRAIKELADADTSSKYAALHRFVDRGSHRDEINGPPIDWNLYDVDYLLGKFRAMFASIGQEQHYLMKMDEETPEISRAAL